MMMPSIFGDNLFDDWMDFPFDSFWGKKHPAYNKQEQHMMKTDVKEKDDVYEVSIDLPGYKKDEISAKLEKGCLTVSATKNVDNDQKDEDGKYIRRERYYGSMSRSFYVGDSITQEDIHAKYEDGILHLTVPKEAPKKVEESRFIAIEG